MRSQYCEMVDTDEQYRQLVNQAIVEWLLNDRTLDCAVCLSPLLRGEGLDEMVDQPEKDKKEGGWR